jgi:hypothetical protein
MTQRMSARNSALRVAAMGVAAAISAIVAIGAAPASGAPQQRKGPQPPGGRTVSSSADCAALQKEWDRYKEEWGRQHQACLDSYNRSNVQAGPTCSRAPCQQLHYLVYEYASSEGNRMMTECRAAVARIEKQKAENEAATRRYNQQIAEQNRKLLAAINQQNMAIAEQNRLAQEAVAERNRAAQQEFEQLVHEYNLRVDLANMANASIAAMRDALSTGASAINQRVSSLVNQLGSVTFGDVVNQASDAADTTGQIFDGLGAYHGIDVPERVTTTLENVQNFASGWNIFQAVRTSLSNEATPQEKFDSQIDGLSNSTDFLFSSRPWVGQIVSDNIERIGRVYNSASGVLDDALNGVDHTNEEINDMLGRAFFPRAYWLNDKLNQLKSGNLSQFFGR